VDICNMPCYLLGYVILDITVLLVIALKSFLSNNHPISSAKLHALSGFSKRPSFASCTEIRISTFESWSLTMLYPQSSPAEYSRH
jgi:hypothetical protein